MLFSLWTSTTSEKVISIFKNLWSIVLSSKQLSLPFWHSYASRTIIHPIHIIPHLLPYTFEHNYTG